MEERIPDLLLEQYLLGEAPEDVVRRIESDQDALARIDEMKAENDAFFQRYPTKWFVESVRHRVEIEERAPRSTPPWKERLQTVVDSILRGPVLIPTAAFVVLAALLIPRMLTEESFSPAIEESQEMASGERVKGLSSELTVYRSTPGGDVEEIDSMATVREGDRLQLSYTAAGATVGVIFSIDGRGTVTLHYPETRMGDASLLQDGEVALPYAYVLDDAPYFEQFFFVAAVESIETESILERAESIADSIFDGAVEDAAPVVLEIRNEVVDTLTGEYEDIEIRSVTVRKGDNPEETEE